MSHRLRSILFATGALVCAGLSAAIAGSTASPEAGEFGELRPVVVTARPLPRGTLIGRSELAKALVERRVPAAFAPPDAVSVAAEARGRKLGASLPAGAYLTRSDFTAGARRPQTHGVPRGTTPVEVAVTGAGALAASGTGAGDLVDVVVTGAPGPGPGAGRTYVAARRVALLALSEARAQTGLPGDRWVATLALTRTQALRLIRAEAIARSLRLLAR